MKRKCFPTVTHLSQRDISFCFWPYSECMLRAKTIGEEDRHADR